MKPFVLNIYNYRVDSDFEEEITLAEGTPWETDVTIISCEPNTAESFYSALLQEIKILKKRIEKLESVGNEN